MTQSEKERKKVSNMKIQSPFLNVAEAGQFLKVQKSTVYQWIYRRKAMNFPVRYHGRKPVFLIEDLIRWSNQQNGIVA